MSEKIDIRLQIDSSESIESEELERYTDQLRRELLELHIEDVKLIKETSTPERTKSGVSFTWGELLLTLVASGGVLTSVINTIQSWIKNHKNNSVKIEINGDILEITNLSTESQEKLIEHWINRHVGSKKDD